MRLELETLPDAISGEADQNKSTTDNQGMQHQDLTRDIAIRFK